MSGFYFYENWTNSFAKVHAGTCSFCNNGRGIQGRGAKTYNGQWSKAYMTKADALKAAQDAARTYANASVWVVDTCAFCC